MATVTLTTEEYAALLADRDALRGECDGLRGEVRTLKIEVSLLEERLKAHQMWGSAIVGFGDRRLKYESGRELDWFIMGFSPRKQNLTLYIPGAVQKQTALLKRLGKHKTGKGCLYINKLEEVDLVVLKELIKQGGK